MKWSIVATADDTYSSPGRRHPNTDKAGVLEFSDSLHVWDLVPYYRPKLCVPMLPTANDPDTHMSTPAGIIIQAPSNDDLLALENALIFRVRIAAPEIYLAFPLTTLLASADKNIKVSEGGTSYWSRNSNIYWRNIPYAGVKIQVKEVDEAICNGEVADHALKSIRVVINGMFWDINTPCAGCPRELERATSNKCFPMAATCTRDWLPVVAKAIGTTSATELVDKFPLVLPDMTNFLAPSKFMPCKPFTQKRSVCTAPDGDKVKPSGSAARGAITRKLRELACPSCEIRKYCNMAVKNGRSCYHSYVSEDYNNRGTYRIGCNGPYLPEDIDHILKDNEFSSVEFPAWAAHVLSLSGRTGIKDFNPRKKSRLIAVAPYVSKGVRRVLLMKDVTRNLYNTSVNYDVFSSEIGAPDINTRDDLTGYGLTLYDMVNKPENMFMRIVLNSMLAGLEEAALSANTRSVWEKISVYPEAPSEPFGAIHIDKLSHASAASHFNKIAYPTDSFPWHVSTKSPMKSTLFSVASRHMSSPDASGLTPERLSCNVAFADSLLNGKRGGRPIDFTTFARDYYAKQSAGEGDV